jgi:hypothetical protein
MSRKFVFTSYNSGLDADAAQFILNWEASTGVSMPTTQRLAVNDLYRGLKGEGTPFGSNLWSIAVSNQAQIFPLIPLNDTSANALSYSLEAVSKGVFIGNYVNMISSDFTELGVIGGTGKVFDTLKSQNFYSISNVSIGAYCRTNAAINNSIIFGAGTTGSVDAIFVNPRNASGQLTYSINDSSFSAPLNSSSNGFIFVQRNGLLRESYRNNILIHSISISTTIQSNRNMYFHGRNDGTINSPTTRELSFYVYGMPYLSSDERYDFYHIIQRLQSNVITGGRQIGSAIPPI